MSNNGFKEGCSVFIQREVRALEDKQAYFKVENLQFIKKYKMLKL